MEPEATESLTDTLPELARRIVAEASARGAGGAECVIREGQEFSATVRLGEIEALKEAGGKGLGIRVFLGTRSASTYTSDFAWPAVRQMIDAALAIARVTSDDEAAGLPEAAALGQLAGDLRIHSPEVAAMGADQGVDLARRCERAALDTDPRLENSEGGSFEARESRKILANSLGFIGEYRRSSCSLAAAPIAVAAGRMERDYWFSAARAPSQLEAAEAIGRKAAERALRRLGGRKIPTARVPVVFDPLTAPSLLGHIFQAVSGESIERAASFLTGQLGKTVAASAVTIVDDGAMPGGFGTAPFDGEGVPKRRTAVITGGILESYLLNSYTARRLGLATTGNAARSLAGNPGVGTGNFYLEPGAASPAAILSGITRGFYVTELIGMGVNLVTGDYSRGATGLWIENGELTYPVEEVTVAGNLRDMLRHITAIGNDLVFRSAIAAPTLVVEGLTVAGE